MRMSIFAARAASIVALAVCVMLGPGNSAEAGGLLRRIFGQRQAAPVQAGVPCRTGNCPRVAPQVQAGGQLEGSGFEAAFNRYRAQLGLAPVVQDPYLTAAAQVSAQNGFGHSNRVSRYQNAGLGSLAQVFQMWLADPPHGDPMRSAAITRYGLGNVGNVWILNLN